MLRKTVSILLMLCAGLYATASQWGAVRGANPRDPVAQKSIFPVLKRLVAGEALRIHMTFDNPEVEKEFRQRYERAIADAYKEWFKNARHHIQKSERPGSFKQMKKILQQKKEFVFVHDSSEVDLVARVEPLKQIYQHCSPEVEGIMGAISCVLFFPNELPVLYLVEPKDFEHFLRENFSAEDKIEESLLEKMLFKGFVSHEIGHTLGLSDQYAPKVYENSDRFYRSTHLRSGMMRDLRGFTCDDADGIINMIDILIGTEISRKQGWKSLCPDSTDVYVDGIAKGTGPYFITLEKDGTATLHTYYRDQKKEEQNFSFTPCGQECLSADKEYEEPVEKDEIDRVVRALGTNEKVVYYDYNYERIIRMVLKNEQLQMVEISEERDAQGASAIFGNLHVEIRKFLSSDGQQVFLEAKGQHAQGMTVLYQKGPAQAPLVSILLHLDTWGHIIKQEIITAPSSEEESSLEDAIAVRMQREKERALIEALREWGVRTTKNSE